MITIADVFEARRKAAGLPELPDGASMGDYADQGLAMLGGCGGCGESLAAYNGYPDRSGVWRCKGCLSDGYETVEAFEAHAASETESEAGSPRAAERVTLSTIVTAIRQATSHAALEWLEAVYLPAGVVRIAYEAEGDGRAVRREIAARRVALGMLDVTLEGGQMVRCPDVCLSPRSIDETDTLHRTRGFRTLTVLDDRGEPRGWVSENARDVLRDVYGWTWMR